MYRTRFIFGVSVLFLAAGIVVTAEQGHGNGPKSTQTTTAPKAATSSPHTTTKPAAPAKTTTPTAKAQHTTSPASGKAQTSHGTNAQAGKGATTKPAPPTQAKSSPKKSTTDKTTTAKATGKPTDKTATTAKATGKPVKSDKTADPKLAKADKPAKNAKSTTTTTSSTSTKTNGGTTTTTELTPVQQKLKQNTNLAAKVASRLPPGTDLMKAAEGFRNLGQFVAAVNVSNNLQLSFTELKAKMVDGGMSLGQAIQAVRPLTASPTIEAQRAEYDARGVIAESEQPTQSTTSGATTVASNSPSPTTTTTASKPKTKAKKPAQ